MKFNVWFSFLEAKRYFILWLRLFIRSESKDSFVSSRFFDIFLSFRFVSVRIASTSRSFGNGRRDSTGFYAKLSKFDQCTCRSSQSSSSFECQSTNDRSRYNSTSWKLEFVFIFVKRVFLFPFFQLDKHKEEDFKKPLQVFFQNEEGLDAGGLRKEFFLLLTKEILNPEYGMFSELRWKTFVSHLSFVLLQWFMKKRIQFGSMISFYKKNRCTNWSVFVEKDEKSSMHRISSCCSSRRFVL